MKLMNGGRINLLLPRDETGYLIANIRSIRDGRRDMAIYTGYVPNN